MRTFPSFAFCFLVFLPENQQDEAIFTLFRDFYFFFELESAGLFADGAGGGGALGGEIYRF